MFEHFWKKCMSVPCLQLSMVCPQCNNLEWRLNKSKEEFELYGCLRCRLLLGRKINENDDLKNSIKKKVYHYRVSGRYE